MRLNSEPGRAREGRSRSTPGIGQASALPREVLPGHRRHGSQGLRTPRNLPGSQVCARESEVQVAPPSGFRPPSSSSFGFLPANPRPSLPRNVTPLTHTHTHTHTTFKSHFL